MDYFIIMMDNLIIISFTYFKKILLYAYKITRKSSRNYRNGLSYYYVIKEKNNLIFFIQKNIA